MVAIGHDAAAGGRTFDRDGVDMKMALSRARSQRDVHTVLRDGSHVLIRPVQRSDTEIIADGFARMSATSRWFRFLSPKDRLTPAELRYLTDIDHHDHEAIGALSADDGRGVGVARYIRDPSDPAAAEISISVVDEWQGRGLGSELLRRLTDRGRQEGIHRFTALVSRHNTVILRMLAGWGARVTEADRAGGTVDIELPLSASQIEDEVYAALRALGPSYLAELRHPLEIPAPRAAS
jgi:RimJ/RimL family protein N-acetyltransferase